MALVALGLVLICWRMLKGNSARWLINSNALAATLVLTASTIVDLDTVAAEWNVSHAWEVGGAGGKLDLCQLNRMGSSALTPLIELERHKLDPGFRDRVRSVREQILSGGGWWIDNGLTGQQADWHRWTWRDTRRLANAREALGSHPPAPAPLAQGENRGCDGAIITPPVIETSTSSSAPLTKAPTP